MLRRSLWKYVGVAIPVVAIAFGGWSVSAQDKPADPKKPDAKKPDDKKPEAPKPDAAKAKNIVDTAKADKQFSTLCELLTEAALIETLSGPGPFTVFAPTNEAFTKLGKDKLDELKKDKGKLAGVLKHHVVNGKNMAADVTKMKTIKTLNGDAAISVKDNKAMIETATIIKTDIVCANGVIHVIDVVLTPPAEAKKEAPKPKEPPKTDEPKKGGGAGGG